LVRIAFRFGRRPRRAAARAEAAVRPDPAALHEAMVEGLLQRIRDPAGIEVVVDVVVAGRAGARLGRDVADNLRPHLGVAAGSLLLAIAVAALAVGVVVAVVVVAARPALLASATAALGARLVALAVALRIGEAADRTHVGLVEVDPDAALQTKRQHDSAVA